ncbi:putative amino acid permease YhdG [Austwickia sp. TVS 96-490-7B]|uniref:amino acid permease n=1 Tax=Austwickia sp. TVS 96-490-7B TaxID=2830843 RepID=UPI001C55F02A|nr:amino acid permease [Austwickia sp. TVS 96-490-7B]MBW3087086.1 putative amino acid permease YhdG [Austwickia sp. TVS 96-490-7B]
MAETGFLRRKPIEQIIEPDRGPDALLPTLGLWQLTAIGVGGIIGAGIFSLAGSVASGAPGGKGVGPAVLLSFLIAGIASAAAAFSYAEFAGMIPRAGSAYTYSYAVLGEVVGWCIGWDLLLEYTAIVAVVAIGISGYFTFILTQWGVHLPLWMMGAPGTGEGHRVDVFAMVLCLFVAFMLSRGIKSAARFETIVVGIKVAVVLLVIVVGAFHVSTGNYTPFAPAGVGGAMGGAATVFFAVFGYDAMSTAAEESQDAQRHMPKAILLSLAISMVLYVGVCLVLTGMVSYTQIDPTAGISSAFASVGLSGLAGVIAVGAIVGILTVMFTFMLGVTRVWWAMSRDGLMPKWFAATHPTRHVPTRVTWVVGVASALIAGLLPIGEVAELTNIGILLAFVLVCVSVIVLRRTKPDLERPFRCPGMPVVPALGVVFSLWLITFLEPVTWARFLVWFVLGLMVYFAYSYRHSALHPAGDRDEASAR